MKLGKVLENRRNFIKRAAETGVFSEYDFGRIFEVSPRAIRLSLKEIGLKEEFLPQADYAGIDLFIRKRNEYVERAIASGKDADSVLEEYGLVAVPRALGIWKETAEKFYGSEAESLSGREKEEYEAAYAGNRPKKSTKNVLSVKETKEIERRGEYYRMLESNPHIAEALYLGYKKDALVRKLGFSDKIVNIKGSNVGVMINALNVAMEKKYDDPVEIARVFLAKGENVKDIEEACGISGHIIIEASKEVRKELAVEGDTPLAFKKRAMREEFFDLYVNKRMTQQEIADAYGVSRNTVINHLNPIRQALQDEEKAATMTLWKNRNVDKGRREKREAEESEILRIAKEQAKNGGIVASKIQEEVGCTFSRVQSTLARNGLEAEQSKRNNGILAVQKYHMDSGKTKEEICALLEISEKTYDRRVKAIEAISADKEKRADYLRKSYADGMSTTKIVQSVGLDPTSKNDRVRVLNSQHKSSDFLMGHPKLKERVVASKGRMERPFDDAEPERDAQELQME